ncbi:hypothetical protein [Streptomyces sp. NPDC048350]|uniref:hypothetical protein n=1 Tax=Streptomyces sp. NPDC048350 TaxID=3365538 RepID=UPI003720CF53
MDATLAFAAAFAVTAAGALAARALRPTAARTIPDSAEWRRVHEERREAYADFAGVAEKVAHILETWPALPSAVRVPLGAEAREHLRTLERRLGPVTLGSSPSARAAAQQLIDECARRVAGLDADDPSCPADATVRGLSMSFLEACRDHLDAETDRHFGIRQAAGRSLFARLSTR